MERKIYKDLLAWKNSADRKPLILQGARQVGKTYIVNYFAGKEYSNSVYCNFEKDDGFILDAPAFSDAGIGKRRHGVHFGASSAG